MLRRMLTFSALVAVMGVYCARAMASDIGISGSMEYTSNNGADSFFAATSPGPASQALAAFAPQSVTSSASPGGNLTLMNNFTYEGGNITPMVFSSTLNGQSGTLTLDHLNWIGDTSNGTVEVLLSGTFNQPGFAQELATASFLLQSDYIGNNVDLMMFSGFAQLTPPVTPEPYSVALLGTGLLGLSGIVWFRRRTMQHSAEQAR